MPRPGQQNKRCFRDRPVIQPDDFRFKEEIPGLNCGLSSVMITMINYNYFGQGEQLR